jgi:hypothetical protein
MATQDDAQTELKHATLLISLETGSKFPLQQAQWTKTLIFIYQTKRFFKLSVFEKIIT